MRFRAGAQASRIVALAVVLVVSGCGATMFNRFDPPGSFSQAADFWRYAGVGNSFLVQVNNPPPGLDAASVAEVLPSPFGQGVAERFVADPEKATHPEWRFVFVFDVPPTFDGDDACALKPNDTPPRSTDDPGMMAAFCHRTELLGQVRAENPYASLRDEDRSEARWFWGQTVNYIVPMPRNDSDNVCLFGRC